MKILPKKGFTIAEVALFLALSGFLMVGIIAGANSSISRQRYNDSVNDFVDVIRSAYTDTLNVSNYNTDASNQFNGGRSTTAVYGRLISIGENDDASGQPGNTIYTYDVVGKAISSSAATKLATKPDINTVIDMLVSDEIDIAILDNTECEKENITGICDKQVFNKIETYNIPWDGRAENSNGDLLKAIILVVRSPLTGTMRTYTYSGSDIRNFHSEKGNTELRRKFKEFLKNTPISEGVLSICVDSDDNNYANRREIRVLDHATNSSGILLYELDNLYDPVNNPDGSRCANHGI